VRVSARALLAGVALDLVFGDPQWLPHPVRGVGKAASVAEKFWRETGLPLRFAGGMFWVTVVGASVVLVRLSLPWANLYWIYSLLACRDLDRQAANVVRALDRRDIEEARRKLSWIVGRDTTCLNEGEIIRATVETVAENLSDGVIAPLFYLLIAGPLGMAAYKSVNTLDSIVGYKNGKYREFGWVSARMDDWVNYVPARLTAVLVWVAAYLLGFDARKSVQITLRDGYKQPSPNAGYPEAAVAGALGVQLGGLNYYNGVPSRKPFLGDAVVPLRRETFGQVRKILYLSEAIFVLICLRWARWR
jgi:adenosylcobinamide-phosphate synthase